MSNFYKEGIDTRVRAYLGFSNQRIRNEWRLYYRGRLLMIVCPTDDTPTGIVRQYKVYVNDSQASGKRKQAIITINYDNELGFSVTVSSNVPKTRFDNDFELSAEIMQLRNLLRPIIEPDVLHFPSDPLEEVCYAVG